MPQFNLLHISDLHIAKDPMRESILSIPVFTRHTEIYDRLKEKDVCGSHNPEALRFLAKFIYHQRESLDAIVATGDLATSGTMDDLKASRDILSFHPYSLLDNSPPYLRTDQDETPIIIGGEKLPFYLLPGNHDRYIIDNDSVNPIKPGGTEFFGIFRECWKEDAVNPFPPIIKDGVALGIIAADFSLKNENEATIPKWITRLAQGKVDTGVLDKLVEETQLFIAQAHEKDLKPVVIWAIHFPPVFPYEKNHLGFIVDFLKEYSTRLFLDEDSLIKKANDIDNQVLAIMAGHTHHHSYYCHADYNFEGPWKFDVQCAGSASQFYDLGENKVAQNYCHILTVNVEDNSLAPYVRNFRLDVEQRNFIEVDD